MTAATSIAVPLSPAVRAVLRLADTCLVHSQRLTEWCGHAPILEEDIAISNMALDLLGQARALLTHAGALMSVAGGAAFGEDDLAFLREEPQFLNLTMVELPGRKGGSDFADTMLRHCLVSAWLALQWEGLASSSDAQLAAIAAKASKEASYHLRHAADWVERLGDGSDESARRMRRALETLWPYTAEMFVDDPQVDAAFAPRWSSLREAWLGIVEPVLEASMLARPKDSAFRSTGSLGRHSEHMGYLLAEMQALHRAHPGGAW